MLLEFVLKHELGIYIMLTCYLELAYPQSKSVWETYRIKINNVENSMQERILLIREL